MHACILHYKHTHTHTTLHYTTQNTPIYFIIFSNLLIYIEYFDWHRKQTSMLNDTNWNSTTAIQSTIPPRPIMANNANKFLIIRCLNKDNHCGGLSDRIKPLLVFIAIAAHTNRILMIRWERPYPIEEFLLPNELNWTVPSYMLNELRKGKSTVSKTYVIGRGIEGKLRTASATVLESRMQSQDGGSTLYPCVVETMLYDRRKDSTNGVGSLNYNDDDNDPELNNSTTYDHCKTLHRFSSKKYAQKGRELYRTIYHDFFRSMFKPHPKIQYIIDDKMKKSNLVPGQFIGCHYRSDYGPGKGKKTGTDMISFVAKKQVRCAALMRPGYPVYFAGDSSIAVNAVREEAASKLLLIENDNDNNSMTTIVITPELSKQSEQHNYTKSRSIPGPLHLDLDKGKVEDFYPAFVDLLVMGNSMCQLYGIGGFGSFASLLSYNASCFYETTGECDGEKHLPKNECCMKYIYKRRQTDALNLAMSF